jgi:hypothetical protein
VIAFMAILLLPAVAPVFAVASLPLIRKKRLIEIH